MKKFLMYLFALVCSGTISAQMPSITSADNAVVFQKLRIDVKIVGNVASSTWTMTFENKSHRTMEGNLTFPLGEGIAVDNYAIDINGRMRNAVPVEKAKATTVFEDISRRKVDPGILEKIDGNSFRTRIYPIAARGGTRTVSIGFNEELTVEDNMLKMNIPLAFEEKLKDFTVNIDVIESALPPKIVNSSQFVFEKAEQTYSLSKTFNDYIPDNSINVVIPKSSNVPEVSIQKLNNSYYFLANVMIEGQKRVKPQPKHITILWDQSLSSESRNLKKELEMLGAYIAKVQPATVRLIAFSNDIIEDKNYIVNGTDWSNLEKRLRATVYDGATNYASLKLKKYRTDEFILFSDGLANYVGEELEIGRSAVYTIASNPKSNFSLLKSIASRSKGEFINLNVLDTGQAIDLLSTQVFKFLGVKESGSENNGALLLSRNTNEYYPSIPTVVSNNILVAGCVANYGQAITLQFGYSGDVTAERTIEIKGKTTDKLDLSRIWAGKKIDELDMEYDKNRKEIEELGRRYGIVTRNTSLMVLEEVRDYIRYNIDPPAELRAEYDQLRGRTPNNKNSFEQSTFNLEYLLARLDKWYNWQTPVVKNNNKFIPPAVSVNEVTVGSFAMEDNSDALEEAVVVAYGTQKKSHATGSVSSVHSSELSSALSGKVAGVSVTNAEEKKLVSKDAVSDASNKDISINVQQAENNTIPASVFKPHVAENRKYLSTIENADDSYIAYLECRKEYRTSTKFYFDVAQFFADRNEKEIALRILSNIAELDQENYELYKGLGYKLKAMEQHHTASYVFKKVLAWRPMEPQPYRDYGLSLVDEGKLQEGLDMLIEGITRKYAANIPNLFRGVQEIFFTDINGLVARYPDLKVKKDFRKYVKPVDSDVRVILSWNLADSYIDLHITDPNSELCDYRNMNTSTGGQFSSDFAGGYGPREFIQHKAVKGTYRIQTNYYGNNIQKVAGPAMIMVEVYKNFGTSREQRTIVAVHPNTTKGSMFDVGELVW